MAKQKFETVEEYFASLSEDIQNGLASIRDAIRSPYRRQKRY